MVAADGDVRPAGRWPAVSGGAEDRIRRWKFWTRMMAVLALFALIVFLYSLGEATKS